MKSIAVYHVNPETGNANVCRAKINCRFGDLEKEHYATKEEAQKAYEARQRSFTFEWPRWSRTYEWESEAGLITVQLSDTLPSSQTHHKLESWLTTPEGETVAYANFLAHGAEYYEGIGEHLVLCDIEVKASARGKGFGRRLQDAIEQHVNLPVYYSGSFTPEGWKAFGAHGRYYPHVLKSEWDKPGVKFNSMGFVASWKNKVPRYPDNSIEYTDEQREAIYELSEQGVFDRMQDKTILWMEE